MQVAWAVVQMGLRWTNWRVQCGFVTHLGGWGQDGVVRGWGYDGIGGFTLIIHKELSIQVFFFCLCLIGLPSKKKLPEIGLSLREVLVDGCVTCGQSVTSVTNINQSSANVLLNSTPGPRNETHDTAQTHAGADRCLQEHDDSSWLHEAHGGVGWGTSLQHRALSIALV